MHFYVINFLGNCVLGNCVFLVGFVVFMGTCYVNAGLWAERRPFYECLALKPVPWRFESRAFFSKFTAENLVPVAVCRGV